MIRSNLPGVCTKLSITLSENAVKMTNMPTWVSFVSKYLFCDTVFARGKKIKKHNWKNQKKLTKTFKCVNHFWKRRIE